MRLQPGSLPWLIAHDLTLNWRRFIEMFARLSPRATWAVLAGGSDRAAPRCLAGGRVARAAAAREQRHEHLRGCGAGALRVRMDDRARTAGDLAHAAGARQQRSAVQLAAPGPAGSRLARGRDGGKLVRLRGPPGASRRQHERAARWPVLARRLSGAVCPFADRHHGRPRRRHRAVPRARSAPRAGLRAAVCRPGGRRVPAGSADRSHAARRHAHGNHGSHCRLESRVAPRRGAARMAHAPLRCSSSGAP